MLRLRQYKPCDAKNIVSWIKDEDNFIRLQPLMRIVLLVI